MRDWILVAVAIGAASAAAARAEAADPRDAGPAPQVVIVPVAEPQAPMVITGADGGSPFAGAAGGGASDAPVAAAPGEPDAGTGEEQIILLVPAKPPPPPEPPKQIRVTVMHHPRPRVEWNQAALELGASTGVFLIGSAALFAGELVPIVISELLYARDVSNTLLKIFSVANAFVLPMATTITIERVKAYSRHYQLEGLGWWATYGAGLLMQLLSSGLTIAYLDVNTYLVAPHLVVFGALTPISQTAVANALATPRDPLAPLEGSAHAPVLLDGNGRPIRVVKVLSLSF